MKQPTILVTDATGKTGGAVVNERFATAARKPTGCRLRKLGSRVVSASATTPMRTPSFERKAPRLAPQEGYGRHVGARTPDLYRVKFRALECFQQLNRLLGTA